MTIEHAHYDKKLASVYDRMYQSDSEIRLAVEFISSQASPGSRILELGIGTGRIAIPLAEHGFRLHGIDGSPAMLEKLRERDPEGRIDVTAGDFTKEGTGLEFDLVTIVLNTFFMAVTKEQQIGCLTRVREQLAPAGRFVLEAFDPAPFHGMTKPEFSMRHLDEHSVMLDTFTVDRSRQLLVGTHTIIDGGPPSTTQHVLRYAFPYELDLLAELAGLKLVERWGGWCREPFTHGSPRHVSVFEPAVSADRETPR
ncbi:bifunctional 2-polyprenyl-6-hydroxyphenol methylase/3-demethylubiquinol 3-O-methyltransferase UbiG [Streptomyces sp. NBC_00878]|uniref:class I SAM-dependent methyltransferase n=1 Tax=Streptomyces sp. NBC_00878 TaxID=2975854 RepID=UPI002257DE36|nr:class I SAM-dependent methyltransferase [Streptomyces sp. NBC_00878]MCX4909694.1 class I SAM-dependent methyltransferase [Streptomyces sp. NBC_00878]